MNAIQKKIILSAIFVTVAMGVFPPWQIEYQGQIKDMGYWWITNPPQHTNSDDYTFGSKINISVLLVQWSLVGLLGFGLVYINKNSNK